MQTDLNSMTNAKWDTIRGDVQKRWGRLTNSDLDVVQGQATKLAGMVADKYGYSSRKAQREVGKFMDHYGMDTGDLQDMAGGMWDDVRETAGRYPWAFGVVGLVLALVLVGVVWKPFER